MIASCIVFGAVLLLFVLLGIVFARGRGRWLIAGYNTLSESRRAKIDEKKLMRLMSRGMFTLAGCTALGLIGLLTGVKLLVRGSFVLFFAAVVAMAVLANTRTKR